MTPAAPRALALTVAGGEVVGQFVAHRLGTTACAAP
jgi:hypothetical protein